MNAKKETLKQNVGFSAIGSIGSQVVNLLGFIFLARLLSPHEFGLMAMVAIFTSFAVIFIEMGMGAALIYNQEATIEHESTAFWFNLGLSILCLCLIVFASSFIAEFFHEPELIKILLMVSFLLPLNALSIVPMAMLQKEQVFKQIAIVELTSLVVGVSIALYMAMHDYGVWALVANLMIKASVKCLLLFVLSGWVPKFFFSSNKLRQLWRYSGYLMGTGIANYFITNIDSVLVGRMLGTQALGAYRYAYQLANLPGMIVSAVLSRVFFASYATYKNDKKRIRLIHFKAVRMIAFFTFPMLLFLAVVADLFVVNILGDKWQEMGHILSLMCIIFMLDSIGGMNNPLFLSQGKTKELFWLTVLLRMNLILAMVIGVQFGLDGLLYGLFIAKVINFVPVYVIVGKTVGFSVFSFIKNIFSPFICSVISVVLFMLISHMTEWAASSTLFDLLLNISVLFFVYVILSFNLQKETLLDIKNVLNRRVYNNE